ncbi:MAG: hypothetical protein BGP16_17315 [Sphingobium sp. 66-54]|nr:MAG: hypothetical protein BGP16_17315 [Sphingobium sp. 66-54]
MPIINLHAARRGKPAAIRSNLRAALRSGAALAVAAMACNGAALAQSGAQSGETPQEEGASTQEIIITGSRLARSTFDAPSPVTVIGGEQFEQRAVVNVGAGIAELPAFRPSTTPTTQGFGSFNVGAQIVNLRGIGVTRNLILVDGRRFAPTTREGSVDLNLIPTILVARTDVVTGGASAAYGSDALAGVVNIVLDKQLEGLKVQMDYGVSDEGDGDDYHFAAAFGSKLGDSGGRFIIGGEYDNQKGIGNCFTRDWCGVGTVASNPFYATNGLPNYIRSDTNGGWFFNSAGVVSGANNNTAATAALRNMFGTGGLTFGPDGTPQAYHPGTFAFALSQIGGDLYPTYTDANITVPVERYSIFAHLDLPLTDSIKAFAEGSMGHVKGTLLQTAYFGASIPIYADNPYIPDALRTFVPETPTSPTKPAAAAFNMGRVLDDVGRGLSISKADTFRFTGGFSGELGGGWQWDAYYQYGNTERLQTVDNNLIVAGSTPRFGYATDAVRDPVTDEIVCRATLDPNPATRAKAAGCVPINLFGAGNVSQAGKDYIFGTLMERINLRQHVVAANVRGDLADLWAGPLSVALGGEYRLDGINVEHDPLSNEYAYFQNFGSDYRGTTKVTEGYLEAELPLAKDVAFARSLILNGAVRYTHYNISGFGSYLRTDSKSSFNATAWKASLVWDPVEMLRFRATQSRDIRAPNFADLFLASASAFATVINRFNTSQSTPPVTYSGGYPSLRPEKADTTTLGMVLSPRGFLDGFRFSVDWYRIKVKDYIGTVPGGAQFIVDRCYAGVSAACAAIDFGPDDTIAVIRNVSLNLDEIETSGLDFEAAYRIPLGGTQSITLRGLATYVDRLKTVSFGDVVDRAGQTGNSAGLAAPRWTANGTLTYDSQRFSTTVQGRYIAGGLYDAQRIGPDDPDYAANLPNSISDNRVASRFYVNLFATFRFSSTPGRGAEIFAAVNNLFDRDPPPAPETQFYTNPTYFDTIGRYFRIGARYKY